MLNHKSQITNKIFFGIVILVFAIVCNLCIVNWNLSFAQENNLSVLSKQIIDAKPGADVFSDFEAIKNTYFKDNKYPEFLDFLKSLRQKKKSLQNYFGYYTALARFYQLKYLEDIQDWNEYFSEGDAYRAELEKSLSAVLKETKPGETINLSAQLLFYRFHKEKQDGLAQEALANLVNSAQEYSVMPGADIELLKNIADQLAGYAEKAEAKKIYGLYVEKLSASPEKSSQLGNIALDFYNQGNLELSETLFDAYIKQVKTALSEEELIPLLINIAKNFAYKDEGQSDPPYAEKIFQQIEQTGTEGAFDEELIYLRAFNLEKIPSFKEARGIYLSLLKKAPQSKYEDEAEFKIAVFDTYILNNAEEGKSYFAQLATKEKISPQVISSLYQLGLLSQWKEDFTPAQDYYNKLIAQAAGDFQDVVILARQRLEEINGKKSIEYNLRTFLDAALGAQMQRGQAGKISLRCHPYKAKKDAPVTVTSSTAMPESGCVAVELRYLWSGDLGMVPPSDNQPAFSTHYQYPGTKIINLVVVDPSGIADYTLDLLDAQ